MSPLTYGSLCAGIGGIDLGLDRAGFECRWQVEIDPFCQRVLAKHWPDVPRHGDIREITGGELEQVDLICGGYPCQPFSQAGKRAGEDDPRHLWPEFARLLRVLRPRFVLLENVPGHLSLGFGRVLGDLAGLGYDAEWTCLRAADFGASHLRKRVFVVAYAQHAGSSPARPARELPKPSDELIGRDENVAHAARNVRDGSHGQDGAWRGVREASDELAYRADGGRGILREPSVGQFRVAPVSESVAASAGREEREPGGQRELPAETGSRLHYRPERPGGELGHPASARCGSGEPDESGAIRNGARRSESGGRRDVVADASDGLIPQSRRRPEGRDGTVLPDFAPGPNDTRWPAILADQPDLAPALKSPLRRVVDGLPGPLDGALADRTKRLRALGNSVVPQIAEWIGNRIREARP